MIIGQYSSKLTEKSRLSIPKKFRDETGDELIAARWYENCIVLVSKKNWNRLVKRLIGDVRMITSPVRNIDRFVLSSAFELKLDFQGRFVVPDILIKHAEIKSDVLFIGLGDRIEIWSGEKWQEMEKVIQKKARDAIEKLAEKDTYDKKTG